ncbi:HTH-type transcriptional activator IlvY [Colwellia hornerae]|uniref:HTH-type transcriptional activator IlvY n=1 Tax=Colwellia hornerae TaxID=89402 RepID=A0A5C6QCX5_9GAMM|nr:HTH-type transcriptional activator IlvY [Colwellia hornerae]TWX58466.1 HTH-type transcriptional activator IlvY [Colwellia hornerae]TWX58702.1 HTH-type transcriptional activator IlvY [Colwellia hornerae]TWX66578.1 HTH-type transcriptional activator IlvY [Colwellia hornerae]
MDLKSLKMFVHLTHSLHFGKTAEAHHVSTSTLSRIIQRLEDQLGCLLLHRDNRSVVLTEAGVLFYKYAEQQLEQWQLLQLSLDQKQAELQGKLHIYCSVTAAYSHLPPLLERFRQQHPLVEIVLTTGDAADAFDQVQQKLVDFAFGVKPESLSRMFYFQHIANVPLAVIAPTMACRVQQQLQDETITWSEVPIILAEHGAARKRFEFWYRKKQQGKPNIYATVSGHEALVSMVALGCGVGMAPKVVVENSPVKDRVQYLQNVGDIEPFDLGICCLNQSREQTLVKAFFEAIK